MLKRIYLFVTPQMRLCLEIDGIWRIGLPVLSFAAKENKRVSYYVERGSAIIDTMNY